MTSARVAVGRVLRAARAGAVVRAALSKTRPLVAYVGWTGENNLGDEAMFAMHVARLDFAVDLVPVPVLAAPRVLGAIGSRIDGICLGGGTLIGNGYFRNGLEALLTAAPNARRFMIGTGCESHDYRIGRRAGIESELDRWRVLLGEFDDVRVRGPQSVETLTSVGVHAQHTGDPALLLPRLVGTPGSDEIGVNVGITDDQWNEGLSPTDLLDMVVDAASGRGLRVRLIPTTRQDHIFLSAYAAASNKTGVRISPVFERLPQLLARIAGCRMFVGMKLHAIIFAATQRVPVVALEYRPKCRDFMTSIGLQDLCLRLDELDADRLGAALDAGLADHDVTVEAIDSRVAQQVGDLERACAVEVASFAQSVR